MMVANWGEMHPQKVVGFKPLPNTWPPEYDIYFIQKFAGPIRVRIPPREYMDPYWAS